jgi:hypothetical protein
MATNAQNSLGKSSYQRSATMARFYSTRLFHQHADSWLDDDDRLHIDTDEARVIIDPR